jgi:hypothetical protein
MKRIVVIFVIFSVITIISCSGPSEEFEYLDTIKEVAGMIDYYDHLDPNAKNLVKGKNEIQGQCGDYSLLFALKTGADLIAVNQDNILEDGVYSVVEENYIDTLVNNLFKNKEWPKDINGDPQSGFIRNNNELWLYHPKIGMYRLSKLRNYTSKTKITHVWNLLDNIEIDVTRYDTEGTWVP